MGMGAPFTALAQEASPPASPELPEFGIHPIGEFPSGYFELTLNPGEATSLAAGVSNSGEVNVAVRAFAANVTNPPNGGFGAGAEEEEPIGPTLWVDFAPMSFDLAPGANQELPFTVAVPEGTAPGQYVTSLVVRTQEPVAIPGTDTFDQIIRGAVAIMVTVPGPITSGFDIGTPTFSTESDNRLVIPITNTGNILVKPAGTLTVTTPEGSVIVTAPIAMGSIYGGLSSMIMLGLPAQMQPGEYLVSLSLSDETTGASDSIDAISLELAARETAPPAFTLDPVSVVPSGDPIQYADVSATITNAERVIPTATVTLKVFRDGQPVEDYVLAQNQALVNGENVISQRYIPAGGWVSGTWTFQIVVSEVDGSGTTTELIAAEVPDSIVVP